MNLLPQKNFFRFSEGIFSFHACGIAITPAKRTRMSTRTTRYRFLMVYDKNIEDDCANSTGKKQVSEKIFSHGFFLLLIFSFIKKALAIKAFFHDISESPCLAHNSVQFFFEKASFGIAPTISPTTSPLLKTLKQEYS